MKDLWTHDVLPVPGSLWQLGQHRLLCGDATDSSQCMQLFDKKKFSLCFTSPPYNQQRRYLCSPFNWHSLMCSSFDQIIAYGECDCHILINLGLCHNNRRVNLYWLEWLSYCESIGWPLFGWYVWDQGSGLPGEWGGRLAPSHEFLFHFNQKRKYPNKWQRTSGRIGGNKSLRNADGIVCQASSPHLFGQPFKIPDSVIRVNREYSRHSGENHPAMFPIMLPQYIMLSYSQKNEIVYDPFCGSGTSILAAENTGRICYAMEIEPSYCKVAIRRWQKQTAQQAIRLM